MCLLDVCNVRTLIATRCPVAPIFFGHCDEQGAWIVLAVGFLDLVIDLYAMEAVYKGTAAFSRLYFNHFLFSGMDGGLHIIGK